ncbi:hypothetical protein XELAEV_18013339mg [Xenopus laevis]|uniref:Uncharacterized protein n=1 Tax=Xenopus laevis TaxID=8355 RepID=A0A974DQE6_XENLA|nr:hypothetical protein XELAEV_18013339mg [Xenopus laevis]
MLILPIISQEHQTIRETACSFSEAEEFARLPPESVLQSKRWVCPLWEKCTSCLQQTAVTSFRQNGLRLANKKSRGEVSGRRSAKSVPDGKKLEQVTPKCPV